MPMSVHGPVDGSSPRNHDADQEGTGLDREPGLLSGASPRSTQCGRYALTPRQLLVEVSFFSRCSWFFFPSSLSLILSLTDLAMLGADPRHGWERWTLHRKPRKWQSSSQLRRRDDVYCHIYLGQQRAISYCRARLEQGFGV